MSKKEKIPVHLMDDWFSGIYIKSFDAMNSTGQTYEISRPHRHDFYYCVLVDKGKMELEVDFKKVHLADRSLFLSYPGQVHRIISAQAEQGWFLAFDPAMLDEQLKSLLDQCLSEIVLVPLSAEQSFNLSSFVGHLYGIYNDHAQMFRQAIAQSMVTALIYQLAASYLKFEGGNLTRYPARSIEITKNFKQILRRNFKTIRRPSEFAAKLNISVSHLNDTVKSVTGFPVTYYIQQELIREAQRLLCYSDLTIKEIAYTLGFEDSQYFNRLFSKVTGISPGAFRKSG